MRKIWASKEMSKVAEKNGNGKVQIYSFFPIDRADCKCQKQITMWRQRLASMSEEQRDAETQRQASITCPSPRAGKKRYQIICKVCGETQGYCWASDTSLTDWIDFHYMNWTDGVEWHGCFTPQISPITLKLCLECTCGNDTRDMRAGIHADDPAMEAKEAQNAIGRDFGKPDSKFEVVKITGNVIPFK